MKAMKKYALSIVIALTLVCSALAMRASAQSFSGKAFGGSILPFPFSFPCTCSPSGVYYVTVGPPSSVSLTYQAGTQKYLSHNLPFARNVLGFYNPLNRFQCKIYVGTSCSVVTAQGSINSVVGSSR
ncbi:hypothetical protein KW799_02835 [Candidatus Parcubacteria bacterium]|nr:hypothetical protein [Candidatus Parcubacteria bacterium]